MADRTSTTSSESPSSGTSPSLLARVRAREPLAWDRLITLYAPLVFYWCRRAGLQDHDVEDVFQEVFQSVLTHVGEFEKSRPGGTFRGWLFTITRNKICDHHRRAGREPAGEGGTEALQRFSNLAAPEPDAAVELASDRQAERSLFRRALELIRGEFTEQTWQAFWRTAADGGSAVEVAELLGMSPGAVRVAKSRVLRRLREEIGDII